MGGTFPNFSRLAVADCVDAKYPVRYNAEADQYGVSKDEYITVFSRKLELHGKLSKHYACDLRGVPGYNIPSPVVEDRVLALASQIV